MQAAGDRCRLFSPEISQALDAAKVEARGAALRAGAPRADVDAVEARALARAGSVSCASPDLATAAARVRSAFKGYAQLRSMVFPGSFAPWRADRDPTAPVIDHKAATGPLWRLWQQERSQSGAPMIIGLAGGSELILVAGPGGPGTPSGARLVLRDPSKAADPFLDPRGQGLAARLPQGWLTQVFFAEALSTAPPSLLPAGARSGVMAVFPARAATALAGLDPREAVRLEIVYPQRNGERVESGYFEVGDFAAGRAFLAVGR
jgi:hypothetical protein